MMRRMYAVICFLSAAGWLLPAHAADSVKIKPLGASYQDDKGSPLKNPEGVACAKSSIIVADTGNGRFVRYDVDNDQLKSATEIKVPQVSSPLRLKANNKGEVLAIDGRTRKIARLGENGVFAGFLEPQNVPEPAEMTVRSLAFDKNDNIYLLDILGDRVVVLDPTGKYLRSIAFPKERGFISDVAVDWQGNVLAVDSLKAQLFIASSNAPSFRMLVSGLQKYLSFAVSVETDKQGRIYLLDQNDGALIILEPDGSFQGHYLSMGWKNGQLNYPAQACLTENGVLAVADRNNSRLQLLKVQ